SRGLELGADLSANVASDDRFDSLGHAVIGCAAFSSATCREMAALVAGPDWPSIEPQLAGADGVDLTLVARLLGRRVLAPEGRRGYCSVRELRDPHDEALWRAHESGEA